MKAIDEKINEIQMDIAICRQKIKDATKGKNKAYFIGMEQSLNNALCMLMELKCEELKNTKKPL